MEYPLVILHGWGATSRSYDKLKPVLEQKGISVFVFDLPGFGNEPAPTQEWNVDNYAAWVEKKIKNRVENKKFILFGHSFGGRIAIKLAARQMPGIQNLILCDAAGVTPRPKAKITIFGILSQSGKMVFSLPILKYFQPLVRKIEYFLAGSRDYYYLQSEVMKGTFKKVISEDLTGYLKEIKIPALIIWGEKDRMTPLSDAYIMRNGIVNSRLEIMKKIGHSPHLEAPETLANIIYKFVGEDVIIPGNP